MLKGWDAIHDNSFKLKKDFYITFVYTFLSTISENLTLETIDENNENNQCIFSNYLPDLSLLKPTKFIFIAVLQSTEMTKIAN